MVDQCAWLTHDPPRCRKRQGRVFSFFPVPDATHTHRQGANTGQPQANQWQRHREHTMKNLTCARCGRGMAQVAKSLPQGVAICQPCRRQERGPYARDVKPTRVQVCVTCETPFATAVHNQLYCHPTCRPKTGSHYKVADSTERGYGPAHRKLRRQWAPKVEAGMTSCSLCGGWIEPGTPWHLDHEPGTLDQYRGPAHASCNTSDGGKRGGGWRGLPVIDKTCATCGTVFSTRYPRQRYCTRECRAKGVKAKA